MTATSELALLLGLTERVLPPRQWTKLERSKLWRRARDSALEAAARADRKARMWRDMGRYDDFSEDEYDDEEPYSEGDLEAKLEKLLGRPPRYKSQESGDHSNLISEAKDRLIQLEKVARESGSKYDADRLASVIKHIEQMQI